MNRVQTIESATSAALSGQAGDERRAAWPIVAVREIQVRLTDRNFLISTLSTMLIMILALGLQGFLASRGATHNVVVSTSQGQELAQKVGAATTAADAKNSVKVLTVADEGAAKAALRDGSADAYLHEVGGGWALTTKNDTPSSALLATVSQVVREDALTRNANAAGTTLDKLMAGTVVRTDQLEGSGTEMIVRMLTGFVLAVLFYMVSLLFGLAIAGSVVEEKQSRIVEIIASAIPIRQLMIGKVLGNTVLAMGQLVLFVSVGLIGLQFTPYKDFITVISGPIGWFAAFFIGGFIALACLWAVAGALSSRQEDLQSTTTPITMLVMVAFFGGILAQGTVQTVLSFVPVVSGVSMPMRLLAGDVPIWQPLLALSLTLAFAAGAVLVGERLYRRSVLQSGGRITIRQALKAED